MRAAAMWWNQAVFYEINTSEALRIRTMNAIWITPFYPSPQVDFGYDVADRWPSGRSSLMGLPMLTAAPESLFCVLAPSGI